MGKKSIIPSAMATAGATELFFQEDLVFLDEKEANDLSYWEFINRSDADSDTESLHSLENGFISWYALSASSPSKSPISDPEIQTQEPLQDIVDDVNSCADHVNGYNGGGDEYCYYQHEARPIVLPVVDYRLEEEEEGENHEDEEEDAEDEEDGYGLDDELVPWQVSGKLGRQRMRKLGKRVFAKMCNSKRNPCAYVKPGCVHGKHGLGIRA